MQQVFLNLLENATKYTPEDSALEISARRTSDAVEISLADQGIGIVEGDQERIFEKFYRGPHTGIGGVGLGLPICRGIIAAHGGTLSAHNRSQGGAVFQIGLPLLAGAPEPELGAMS
jgi:two-component system sensor histidine kinase KdpD